MQNGEYRRATAFAAHTAQAHRETPSAAALYAWLLYLGGHGARAKHILSEAEKHFANDTTLALTRRQLDSNAPIASGALLKVPARLAPFGPAPGLPAKSHVAGSGLLVDQGRRAIVPLAAIKKAANLWVRDGLGRFSRATVEHRTHGNGLAIVRLDKPIDIGAGAAVVDSNPFPGSAAFVVEYVATDDAAPSWPLLSSGFIGRPRAGSAQRQLDKNERAGARGGPVFNAAGGLVGVAMADSDGNDFLLPVSQLRESINVALGTSTESTPTDRMPVDQIYELALRTTVQVILKR